MRQQKIILSLVVLTVILIMFLKANVGYASVTNFTYDDVITSPEMGIFRVKFYGKPTVSGNGNADVKFVGDTAAKMNITGLKKAGDSVTVTFRIKNTSNSFAAILLKTVENSNSKYFKVDVNLSNNKIHQRNGEASISIKVELIKTPVKSVEKTNICVRVIAQPDYQEF